MDVRASGSRNDRHVDPSEGSNEDRATPSPSPRKDVAPRLAPAVSAKIDSDLVAYAHARGAKTDITNAKTESAPRTDKVLYFGLNDYSTAKEIGQLRRLARLSSVVRENGSTVTLDGKRYDLAGASGCTSFCMAMGTKYNLPIDTQRKLAFVLTSTHPASLRDELARMALVMAPGENGGEIPSRVVLSGHSNGSNLHFKGEVLDFHSIRALGQAMPNASKQIEDIHISGCFSAGEVYNATLWQETFPNLKTMWGYTEIVKPHMPGRDFGPWEARTRGRTEGDPSRGTHDVVSWSVVDGIKSGVSLETLRKDQKSADERFDQLRSGALETKTAHVGTASYDYAVYRQLSFRPELPASERQAMTEKADVLFRVRFYHGAVRTQFAMANEALVKNAFEGVKLPSPDIAKLSRTEALAAIRELEKRATSVRPLPEAVAKALPVLRAFARLDPSAVPASWCHE